MPRARALEASLNVVQIARRDAVGEALSCGDLTHPEVRRDRHELNFPAISRDALHD